jgi:hypothetical protein
MFEHTLEALESTLGGRNFGAQSAPLVADDHIGPESMISAKRLECGMYPLMMPNFIMPETSTTTSMIQFGLWQRRVVHREFLEYLLEILKSCNLHDCTEVL